MPRLLIIFILIIAVLAGVVVSRWLLLPHSSPSAGAESTAAPAAGAESGTRQARLVTLEPGTRRPPFRHGRTDGSIVTMADFDGQVVLVNFWAPWCEPCREEMPLLQQLAREWQNQGFVVVGIALDDVARVREFVAEYAIEYPILVGGPDVMETSRRWGNRAGVLPDSVLVDRAGVVRWTELGPLREADLRAQVTALLE